ncbi:uncharacterized protein METZ01_LOCUS493082, partial [marine metagenome]
KRVVLCCFGEESLRIHEAAVTA